MNISAPKDKKDSSGQDDTRETGGQPASSLEREGNEEQDSERHRPIIHNGSAGAFDATENSHEDYDDDAQDNDDFAMER